MQTFSAYWTDDLGKAIAAASTEPYRLRACPGDAKHIEAAINQGIDSHLEACFIPDRGDSYQWGDTHLKCKISPESFPVLIRRLMESDSDDAQSLAFSLCDSLDIELI